MTHKYVPDLCAATSELVPNLTYRSSHPEEFCKQGFPKNFAKFTAKQLCWSPKGLQLS